MSADFKPATQFSAGSQPRGNRSRSEMTAHNSSRGFLSALAGSFKPRSSHLLASKRSARKHGLQTRGAVRLDNNDNQGARRNLFVLAIGCIATSGIIYGVKLADSAGGLPGISSASLLSLIHI